MTQPSIAVILAGCGHRDGSEIHEATLTLWAIHKQGADYQCYAPDMNQHHVLNHITGEVMEEERNVFVESARISRGRLKKLHEFNPANHEALILPGGLGAAKNLSTFSEDGADCQVIEPLKTAILAMARQHKPIGALCIAPVVLARLLADIRVTIGNSVDVAHKIEAMGARHQMADQEGIVIDQTHRIVTTPCYMYNSRVDEIGNGIEKLVTTIVNWCSFN